MNRKQFCRLPLVLMVALAGAGAHALAADSEETAAPGTNGLTLEAAIRLAQANNPEIRVLAAGIASARGEAVAARAWQNPEISVAPGFKQFRDSSDKQFHGDFGLEQTFEWPGKRALRKAVAEKNIAARQLALDGFRTQLAIQVRKAYFNLLTAREAAALQAQRLSLAGEFVAAAKKRVEGGYAPEFEATKAEVEVITAQKAWRETRAQEDATRITLNTLMGSFPDAPLSVPDTAGAGEVAMPEIFAVLTAAMRQNPAIKLQEAEVERAGLNLQAIRKSRLPDFKARPGVEYTRDEQIFGFGISLPLPLWDSKKGETAAATADQARVLAELDKLKQEILRDVTAALKNQEAARDSLGYYAPEIREKLKAALEAAARGYAGGRTPLLLYLETQRTYFDTQADYYETRQKLIAAQADVESAAGVPLEQLANIPQK